MFFSSSSFFRNGFLASWFFAFWLLGFLAFRRPCLDPIKLRALSLDGSGFSAVPISVDWDGPYSPVTSKGLL